MYLENDEPADIYLPADEEIVRQNRHSTAIDMVYDEINRMRQSNASIPYLERSHIRMIVNEYLAIMPRED